MPILYHQLDLVSFLNKANIFLLPMNLTPTRPLIRGYRLRHLEYQALGKPIICVSNGEVARYISETKSGLVIPREILKNLQAYVTISKR